MASREREGAVGKRSGKAGSGRSERRQIIPVEPHDEPMRDDRASSVTNPLALHGPLEPALDLDRSDRRPEQPCGLALEEPFEKTLDGGKGSHVGGGV